jgi:sialate O-acetylesterase
MIRFSFSIFLSFVFAFQAFSQMKMPAFFSDSMVLQQQTEAVIWGMDKPKTNMVVKGSWGKESKTTTDANGKWRLTLPTPAAGGPYNLVIKGSETITLQNVLIGEVWLCSGQSNMEMPVKGYANQPIIGSNETILNSANANIRVYTSGRVISRTPANDIKGNWKPASPATTGNFSAAAYYFAKKMNTILGVPIGLIVNAWGGSSVESWMDSTTLASFGKVVIPEKIIYNEANKTPTALYNTMLHPYIGFTIKGIIWYQGEGNRRNPEEYQSLFSSMITSWRNQWQQGIFPFYFVQLAPHGGNVNLSGALVREAQLKTMQAVEKTGMVVTLDIGEQNVIHPAQKEAVGNRLAYWALAKDYNIQGIAFTGPVFKRMEKTKGDSLIVSFDYAELGLTTFGKPLTEFEIAGEDKVFYPAKVIFTKDRRESITVWNESIKNPVSVRYGFKNWVEGCLFNTQGLPASSFRTDDWSVENK